MQQHLFLEEQTEQSILKLKSLYFDELDATNDQENKK